MPPKAQHSKSVIIALSSNLFVSLLKFVGYFITLSPSMLSEAIHSTADTGNQLFLWIGERSSSLETSKDHPWGRGSFQYLYNFMSAIGIFVLGCLFSIYHSVLSLITPAQIPSTYVFLIACAILIASFFIEGYSLFVVVKEIRQKKGDLSFLEYVKQGENPTLAAVLLEDSIAVGGVVLALIAQIVTQITSDPTIDAVIGVIIGCILGFIAFFLAITNAKLLVGQSVSSDKEAEIKEFLLSFEIVEKVYNLKTKMLKPGAVLVNAEIEIHGSSIFNDEKIEKQLNRDIEEIIEFSKEDNTVEIRKILVKTYDRSNRIYGDKIDKIQSKIKKKFPEIVSLTLEIR